MATVATADGGAVACAPAPCELASACRNAGACAAGPAGTFTCTCAARAARVILPPRPATPR